MSSEGGITFLRNLNSLCSDSTMGLPKCPHSISVCLGPSKHHRLFQVTQPNWQSTLCVSLHLLGVEEHDKSTSASQYL